MSVSGLVFVTFAELSRSVFITTVRSGWVMKAAGNTGLRTSPVSNTLPALASSFQFAMFFSMTKVS